MLIPTSPLPDLDIIALDAATETLLQRFFEANPFYFETVNGLPAQPGEAHQEIFEPVPPGWPYTTKFVLGYRNHQGDLVAMANVVSDLLAPHVWHVGAFIVATAVHGTGIAMGQKTNIIRVLVKALTGQPLSAYFDLVVRDRPEPDNTD